MKGLQKNKVPTPGHESLPVCVSVMSLLVLHLMFVFDELHPFSQASFSHSLPGVDFLPQSFYDMNRQTDTCMHAKFSSPESTPTVLHLTIGSQVRTWETVERVKNPTALQYLTQTDEPGTYYHAQFKGTLIFCLAHSISVNGRIQVKEGFLSFETIVTWIVYVCHSEGEVDLTSDIIRDNSFHLVSLCHGKIRCS
jgi:hypothetical protein